jgi:hypothetical protein
MIRSKWAQIAVMSVVFLGAAVAYAEPPTRLQISRTLTSAVRDSSDVRPSTCTERDTPLKAAALGTPLLAPNGRQLTWGEWARPFWLNDSVATVQCVNKGTHVTLRLSGLIPKGLYSVWLFVRHTPDSPVDAGRLPSLTSKNNGLRADRFGRATFDTIAPAGPLSISGSITKCLFDETNFSFNLAYHSDGRLYGDVPGPDGVTVQQFNFEY